MDSIPMDIDWDHDLRVRVSDCDDAFPAETLPRLLNYVRLRRTTE